MATSGTESGTVPPTPSAWKMVGPQWEYTNALKRVTARASAEYALKAQADVMSDQDLAMVRQWAATAPTVDIRATAALAFAQLGPDDQAARDIASASAEASVLDDTYANVVGIPGNGITKRDGPAAVAKPDDHQTEPEQSWWQTALDNITPDSGNEFWDNVMPDPNTAVGGVIGQLTDAPQTASRWALTTFQSGLDFVEAGLRTEGGAQDDLNKIGEKYRLTTDQQRWVAENGLSQGENNAPRESLQKSLPGIGIVGPTNTDDLTSLEDIWNAATPEQRDRMTAAAEEWRSNDKSNLGKQMALAGKQVAIVQAMQDPDLINKDKGSWLPTQEIESRKEVAALEARDIRTTEEILRGVEPTAWTPGRGLAHIWWSPDEEAFHTWSGVADFGKSVTLDPVNFIPVGIAGKAITKGVATVNKGSKSALKVAIEGKAGKTIVVTDSFASQGAAESRRGKANVAAAKADGVTYSTDPVFQNRNVTVLDDGRVTGPYGQYLAHQQAWTWLNSGKGMRVVDDLAGRTSAYDIWKRSGGERGGMSWELAQQLSDAQTPAAVRAILGSRIGMEIDNAGQLTRFGANPVRMTISTTLRGSKVGKYVERQGAIAARGNVISVNDSDTLARELDAFGTAAKIPHDLMAPAMDAILRAPTAAARYGAIYNDFFHGVVKDHLVSLGLDEADARKVTTAYEGGFDQSQRELWNRGIAMGGGPTTGFPTLMSENLSDVVSMPSYREMLRAASATRRIRKALPGDDEKIADFLQNLTSDWRNLVLFRPAYTLREVGEMSFSMALSGSDSLFTHPLQAIALVTHVAAISASKTAAGNLLKAFASGKADPHVRQQLRLDVAKAHEKMVAGEYLGAGYQYGKYAVKKGVYETSTLPVGLLNAVMTLQGMNHLAPYIDPAMARVTGDGMFDELQRYLETGDRKHLTAVADAMSVTHGNFIQDQASKTFGTKVRAVRRPDLDPGMAQDYAKALADRLRKGSEDPDIRNIAKTGSDPDYTINDVLNDYVTGTRDEKHVMFMNSKGFEDWADPNVHTDLDFIQAQEEILRTLTGSDAELIEAVHLGQYKGKPIGPDNEEFVAKVRSTVENDPATFPQELGHVVPDGNAARQAWDRVTADFFQNTAAFSDVFARGPMVREAYVQRVLELGENMSPAAKAEVVANLRNAGDIGLARRVQAIKATGGLTVEEVDGIAAGFARKEVQRIFYDASRRQNWAVALRVVSPFAQATMNTFKRWGTMSVQNPQSYYRALKPLVALEQPGSAALYDVIAGLTGDDGLEKYFDAGHPSTSEAQGFFFNDRYGEKKFAYPLVGPIAKLFGAPTGIVPLGSLENLNVAGTSFNPGFGPTITLAASFALGDDIHEKSFKGDVLRMMWPYGYPDDSENPLDRIVDATLPTAYKKFLQAWTPNSPTRMNTSANVLSGLINSGQYDMQDKSDVTRLMNDADQLASRLGMWSAIFGAFTPSTFQTSALIETQKQDPESKAAVTRWIMVDRLMEEYQKYTKDDYKQGTFNFVNDFGGTALFAALPRTKTDVIAQATNDMWQFRTDNPTSYEENIEVIGLFMSNDDLASNFARELFLEQRQDGVRGYMKLNGPGGYLEKVNETLGWMIWNKGTDDIDKEVGDDEDRRARLRSLLSEDLAERFPGFAVGAKDTASNEKLWNKIRDALDDPAIQTLPSYYYVNRYIRQRDAALEALRAGTKDVNSLGVLGSSKTARQLWLLGQQYANEDTSGGFRHMWNRVLSQELDPYGPVPKEETK